ncbi:MAG TPA: VWA domain-containing protein [Thermoanaerobaculia bacterium]|nr:VWA domain-containing protein [Thermoanaerobaculia bacterium]
MVTGTGRPKQTAGYGHRLIATGTAWLAVALLAATSAAAAEAPPAFAERIEVQLIDVEVLVTDRDGVPVTDLHREDFRVFEDGAEVPITHFSRHVAALAGAPATAGEEIAETPPLHLGVFLDDVHIGPMGRQRALRQMANELAAGLRPEDRVMVAIYDGTVRVALPFSTDRRALRRVLEDGARLSVAGLLVQQERRFAIEAAFRDAMGDGAPGAGGGSQPCLYMESLVTNFSEVEAARLRQAQRAFGSFVDSLRGIDGRKAVLHLSDGIPMRAGSEIADYAYELCGMQGATQGLPESLAVVNHGIGGGYYNAQTGAMDSARYDMSASWAELTARANAGNVSIYAFQAGQPEGLQPGSAAELLGGPSLLAKGRRSGGLQDTLFLLADETGGRASLHGSDISADVALGLADLRDYYLLGYQPSREAGPGVRKIRVEVARPGVQVRHRKAYRPRNPDEQVADQLLARLLYGAAEEPSRLALERAGDAGGEQDTSSRLRLRVPLDSLALVPQGELSQGLFTVFVVVGEPGGASSVVRQRTLPVQVPTAEAAGGEYVWEVEVPLRAPRDTVAVAVRDELSGETSFLLRRF